VASDEPGLFLPRDLVFRFVESRPRGRVVYRVEIIGPSSPAENTRIENSDPRPGGCCAATRSGVGSASPPARRHVFFAAAQRKRLGASRVGEEGALAGQGSGMLWLWTTAGGKKILQVRTQNLQTKT
jgi:hypothetical protein